MKTAIINSKGSQTIEDSNSKYRQYALEILPVIVLAVDIRTYEIVYANRHAKKLFGDIQHKTCWKVLQCGQTGPCSFCKSHKIIDPGGKPTQPYLWEHQNTVTGKWYNIMEVALQFGSGRLVKFQMAMEIVNNSDILSSTCDHSSQARPTTNRGDANAITVMCQYCNHFRDEIGNWHSPAKILEKYSNTSVSHGICTDCFEKYCSIFNPDG